MRYENMWVLNDATAHYVEMFGRTKNFMADYIRFAAAKRFLAQFVAQRS